MEIGTHSKTVKITVCSVVDCRKYVGIFIENRPVLLLFGFMMIYDQVCMSAKQQRKQKKHWMNEIIGLVKEIQIIHRLFLVIAMHCHATSMNH